MLIFRKATLTAAALALAVTTFTIDAQAGHRATRTGIIAGIVGVAVGAAIVSSNRKKKDRNYYRTSSRRVFYPSPGVVCYPSRRICYDDNGTIAHRSTRRYFGG